MFCERVILSESPPPRPGMPGRGGKGRVVWRVEQKYTDPAIFLLLCETIFSCIQSSLLTH